MVTMYKERTFTVPEIYPEHQEFWAATAMGKLLLKKCEDCQEFHYYPRAYCPHCAGENTVWIEAQGTGSIYTYSVLRMGVPYAIAYIELTEGVRMMTNLVDCDLDSLQIGQQVRVVFKQSGDGEKPGAYVTCFTPIY